EGTLEYEKAVETTVLEFALDHQLFMLSITIFCNICFYKQLLRERQQMASRPFASVDVALEVGADQTDFLRGPLELFKFDVTEEIQYFVTNKLLTGFIIITPAKCSYFSYYNTDRLGVRYRGKNLNDRRSTEK
ncbi:hypothetical protein STEG23_024054, partial [Scotinomys teguina]